MQEVKYFDTFAGAAGISLGIERTYGNNSDCKDRPKEAQHHRRTSSDGDNGMLGQQHTQTSPVCIGFSENDKYASAILKHKYPNTKNYGDITQIDWSTVPDFDILTGGSPCQDISVAGKRKGLAGERSGLFYEYIRALKEKKPEYFIWENVKGVLSSKNGWDFANIKAEFSEAGYSIWWQVLNAKDFGVAQNRERIFVIGFRNRSPREVFFERRGEGQNLREITKGVSDAQRIYDAAGLAKSQKALGGGLGAKTGLYEVRAVLTPNRVNKRQNGRRMKEDGEPMFTLTGQDIHGVMTGTRIRRLMPIECERLMSWPDDWTKYGDFDYATEYGPARETKEMSDTQRYKACGNGVVSNVVELIIKELGLV